jgi:hypothetical protein
MLELILDTLPIEQVKINLVSHWMLKNQHYKLSNVQNIHHAGFPAGQNSRSPFVL